VSKSRQAVQRDQRRMVERRQKVAQLRLQGVTDQCTMAAELGVSQQTISRDLAWLDLQYRAQATQDVAVARGLELAQIQRLLSIAMERAQSPRGDAHWWALGAIKLLERKVKLLGLDAAPRVTARRGRARTNEQDGVAYTPVDMDAKIGELAELYDRQAASRQASH